jgi:hypothetical protein
MKQLRRSLAFFAIAVLIAAAVMPGGADQLALAAAVLLLFPVVLVFTRLSIGPGRLVSTAPRRASVLLRAPPAISINR